MSERIDTAALLDDVRGVIARYVVLPGDAYFDAAALWVLHAHAIEAAETTPRLVLKSPEKESGKTRMLEVLESIVPAPLDTFSASVAALYRTLKDEQATLLFDEVDAIFNPKRAADHEELRALLNAGYRRGATVRRCVGEGKKQRVEKFPVFAATALAAIGDLPDTIESRAVIVPMRRRAPDEQVEAFRRRKASTEAHEIRGQLERWAAENVEVLKDAEPELPVGVTDRAADIWEPLLAIAELAGDTWKARADQAATTIVAGRVAEDASIGVRLLADLRVLYQGHDRMSSKALCEQLNGLEESPWGGWHAGNGIGQRDLAKRLKPYGIESKDVRLPDGTHPKGYLREDFEDAWARYLRHGSATGATSATQIRIPVAPDADVADTNGHKRCRLVRQPDGWYVLDPAGTAIQNGQGQEPGAWSSEDAARAWAMTYGFEVEP
jgi:hypothetical protein